MRDVRSITADAASTDLAALLEQVARGEMIVITKNGVPIAKLVPVQQQRSSRRQRIAAVRRIQRLGTRLSLGELTIKEMIEKGRR